MVIVQEVGEDRLSDTEVGVVTAQGSSGLGKGEADLRQARESGIFAEVGDGDFDSFTARSLWIFRHQLDLQHERWKKKTLHLNPCRGRQRRAVKGLADILTGLESIKVRSENILFHNVIELQPICLQGLPETLVHGLHRDGHLTLTHCA